MALSLIEVCQFRTAWKWSAHLSRILALYPGARQVYQIVQSIYGLTWKKLQQNLFLLQMSLGPLLHLRKKVEEKVSGGR